MRILLGLVLYLLSIQAFALGNLGHETVCEIAYQELTPTAREAVDRLIAQETNSRYQTFSRACSWADDKNGGRTKQRSPDHYLNVPRDWSSIAAPDCVKVNQCLFSAIRDDESKLRSRANDHVKLIALKYLSHWVADIHQPLHVSFKDDYGANSIHVKGIASCDNLHSVWDRCIPQKVMASLGFNPKSPQQKQPFAQKLWQSISKSARTQWQKNLNPLTWANESLALSRQPAMQYCVINDRQCQYSETDLKHRVNGNHKNTRTLHLNNDYLEQMAPLVETRMQQAGVRLGALLNDIFKN